ncbi:VCBS repeat-containing protein [Nonomuraea sp. NPDC050310]|uniref:FG-GAP repeat domain-containing protein n=1 Tax=Nonomuraea sp. NPDC050310 TaxID=3154935 RepID=UPI00340AEAFA
MISPKRFAATATLSLLALSALSAPALAAPDQGQSPAADLLVSYLTAPCASEGTTAADTDLAARLNGVLTGSLAGAMTGYRASCARKVVKAVRDRGLSERAAVIAITTTIVESTIQNVAEKVDHDSLGLFQQRDSWGSESNRLDPVWATNRFLDSMISKYPEGSWASAPIGEVCQAVQVSAYPDRYQTQAADAGKIVDALWASATSDLDGDGTGDVFSAATGRLTIWNGDGRNSLGPVQLLGSGWETYSRPVAGDFTGDGKNDLAAVKNDQLHLWKGTGPNSFVPLPALPGTGWNKYAATLVSPGDLDSDGHADLAAIADDRLFIWNGTGTGTFGSAQMLPGTGWAPYTRPVGGDFNGDGKGDLAGVKNDRITLWYGNGANGIAGTFTSTGTGWNKYAATLVGPGDLNRDGRDDLAGVYNDQVTLWNTTPTGLGGGTTLPGTGWTPHFPG